MWSIVTNSSAMTALQNLSATQKALNNTQSQISSGLKVSTASDNAAYWSIATTMTSDQSALSALSSDLDLGASVLNVAAAAVSTTLTSLARIRADLVTAQQPGASLTQVQTDITAQQQSIVATLSSASFSGTNLLDNSQGASTSFVTSYARNATGATSLGASTLSMNWLVQGISGGHLGSGFAGASGILGTASLTFYPINTNVYGQAGTGTGAAKYVSGSILSFDITSASASDLQQLGQLFDGITSTVSSIATRIAAVQTTIANQQTYVSSLFNALTSGVGSLVDADMNVASTRLQALQTQQQLGIQALSIANQNSQLILKLFQAA